MKKRLTILFALVSLVAALAAVAATPASALSYSGQTWLAGQGGSCLGGPGFWLGNVHIAIRNVTTGANGATNSNGSGQFSIGGLVAGNRYEFVTSAGPAYRSCLYHYTPGAGQNVNNANLFVY
jgi:hypothetical protein